MQIPYPQRTTYTNDSLALTPPAPTILQQRLATPPTSPETFAPPQASLGAATKRLRNSKSFPLITATNRLNTSSRQSRTEDKPLPDVFSSTGHRPGKSLRKKQSRGVLRDDYDVMHGGDRASGSTTGSTERGLKKKTSFQRTGKQLRLRRTDNSTRSLRSEYHLPSDTPPRTNARGNPIPAENEKSKPTAEDDGQSEEEGEAEGGKVKESKSCDVEISDNSGTTPIPRSHSDPLSGPSGPALALGSKTEQNAKDDDSDEETRKYDPKEVFSKERFLNRHSRDFGHLYAHSITAIPLASEDPSEDAVEHLALGPEVDISAVRREGREKRRSWALYRAGLVSPVLSSVPHMASTPHSAPAGSTAHSISRDQPTTTAGKPGHHRRTSSFVTGAHHPSLAGASSVETIRAQVTPSTLPRQKVMSGGFKPLALVAVAKATSPVSLAGTIDRTHRKNRWSIGSTGVSAKAEVARPAPEVEDREEELSVIDEQASEKSRGSIAVTRFSDHSRASLSSIPAHLRTHSSSTTSSLSSLGAIINNGSPSKSTSSCSSGGEHLGGPRVLTGEAFNFRMSVVSGGGRRSVIADEHFGASSHSFTASESRGTVQSSSSDGLSSMRTDSRMTLRGGRLLDGQIDPAEALGGQDKDARAARRRARAFLVAGLKLEEGSLFREEAPEQYEHKVDATSTRRDGLVIDQPIDLDAAMMQENKSRKRYSVMRAEKSVLQPSSQQAGYMQTLSPPFSPSLLPRPGVHGSAASSASSYHTAMDRRVSDSPDSETSAHGFMEMLDERVQPADSYQGRHSISPITVSSAETTRMSPRATAPDSTPNGITIAIYDPTGHARQASLASFRDSIDDRPAAQRDNSNGSSGDPHLEEQEMDSLELERQLFFSQPSSSPAATRTIRKVKSDFGLGASQIALPHGRSMSRPTSPVIIHEDSAGASPGRPKKTNWSKGVRQWWRDDAKTDVENETERGFGLGRGGDESRIPVPILPPESGQEEERVNAAAPTPSPHLREKKSWRPFLAALRGGKGRTVERVGTERMGTSQPLAPPSADPASMPSTACATSTMTLDPPFMEQSTGACSAESTPPLTTMTTPSTTNWLSPLPLPTSLTIRTRDRYSPFSATTFSPQTPEHLIKSPGTMRALGIQHGQQQPRGPTLQPSLHDGTRISPVDSRHILSPTPGISPNNHQHYEPTNRLYQSRQFSSESRFEIQKPAPIHLAKAKSLQELKYATSEQPRVVLDKQGRDVRGPLHGLGLHVGWADDTIDYKGKAKATSAADEDLWESKLHHQASQLLKLQSAQSSLEPPLPVSLNSNLGRRPAVGILTNAGVSPTSSQPAWPSSTVSAEPAHSKHATAGDVAQGTDENTVIGSVISTPHSPTFAKTRRDRDYQGESQAMINMHCRELQPAKLFFLLGFLLGPWVWLLGGWGLSPGGYFASSSNTIHLGLSWKHAQAARLRRQVANTSSGSTGRRPLLPPMSRDEPDKWVKRNRWAAVASAGIFIPAMCVGFASVGALL